ncbi:MAG: GTPase Era [Bacilli bacterium]|nr:GTPase Era [Bacilli bacterium]
MRSGFVSIIGRPNVGKSTLLNSLINAKVAITSDKAQTTRNIIQGIYNEKDVQIVFVDTPGIHKPVSKLGKVLNKQSYSLTKDVDAILFVVDAKDGLGKGDKYIINSLEKNKTPVILVLNKIDKMTTAELMKRINEYKDLFAFSDIVPVSALKKDNINRLISVVKNYLTDNVKYFDDDIYTSNSVKFMISEIVREKLLNVTSEEIPHSLTCYTVSYNDKGNIIDVNVDIIVDRDSIKKIIIGKKGDRLKEVGSLARVEIEKLVGKQVYLELFVKTIKNWKEKDKYLSELGFTEFE